MSDLTDATLAVLAEMDWPDDREFSAHVEPDGYQLTPPGAYWDMAHDVARAAINAAEAIIRADERAKVAEEIATAIATNPNVEHSCCDCGDSQDIYAAIARTYATKPAETAAAAPTAHAESHRMGEGSSGAQEAVG